MNDNFYITLISNAPSRYQETNTTSSFRTDLYSELPINNGENYEVALTEVLYLHSWKIKAGIIEYSFENDLKTIEICIFDGENISKLLKRINSQILETIGRKIFDKRLKVYEIESLKKDNQKKLNEIKGKYPRNDYETGLDNDVISDIKKTESEIVEMPKFFLENDNIFIGIYNTARIQFFGIINTILKIKNKENISKIYLKENGLTRKEQINETFTFKESEPIQITQKLYFYTDFISNQFVSNIKTPLLRSIIIDYHDEVQIKATHFSSPYYLKVNKTNISSILIEIKDEKGLPIMFENATVEIKLHFRRIKK